MRERILVVDDEEAIREIVSHILVSANYEVQQAVSGEDALAVLASGEKFELILSDIMMADLDGIGMLEKLKVEYPEVPVVFVTSIHDVSVALVCFRSGAYDYLMEPFESDQLLATTRRAFKNHALKIESRLDETTLELLIAARTEELREKVSGLESQDQEVVSALRLDDEGAYCGCVVTGFTVGIARAMGLSSEQINVISCGASIHDIGQFPALRNILLQPDALHPGELALMCQLCNDIYKMLKPIQFLADASEIVYAYSECFDGTGYPRGLKGHEIPLGARILSVAHMAPARAEVQRRSGHQFDPEVVKTVLSMPESIWASLSKEAISHR
jgi:response regulator RpfG family c-di-GMP phosphodiesterase